MLGEGRQRPQVSWGDTCFARDTYPSVPFHLMNRYLDKHLREITKVWRTTHYNPRNTMDDTQGLCNSRQYFVLR
jgi:hypothetical protein